MFKDQFMEPTLDTAVVPTKITKSMYTEQFMDPNTFVVIPAEHKKFMTKSMFKEQYMEPTLNPVVIPASMKDVLNVPFNSIEFFEEY